MRSPARIHWRIHESIHSGIHAGLHDRVHASLHGCIHESIHKGVHDSVHGCVHDSVHESIHGGVHEIPPRLLDRMPDVYTKQVLHIHLIAQAAPETRKTCKSKYRGKSYGGTKVRRFPYQLTLLEEKIESECRECLAARAGLRGMNVKHVI
jgi:hypothetical protein